MSEADNESQHKSEAGAAVIQSRWQLYLKGVAMGLGDSVPGVSGGTIAVITNIYDTLIYSISALDLRACKLLLAGRLEYFWLHINGSFLLLLSLGVLSGLLLSANTVLFLLDNYFEPLMAFFIGLVLASSWLLKDSFEYTKVENWVALLLGVALTVLVSSINPFTGNLSYTYVFISGGIAICAMILPGLSGAFILLLLGVYEFILEALIGFDLPYILVFVAGCIIGLLAFSRVIGWMLHNYHQLSYGFIVGMLIGSLVVLWPWQQAQNYYTDSAGELQALQTLKLWPLNYTELTGNDAMLLACLVSMLIGLAMVLLLHRMSNSSNRSTEVK